MYTPDLPADSALAANVLYFLMSFASCMLALLGAGYLARPRRPQPTAPPPGPANDQLLKTYLEHQVLC